MTSVMEEDLKTDYEGKWSSLTCAEEFESPNDRVRFPFVQVQNR